MGKLLLCATPIGNLEDLSPRAVRALAEADVVACEDTRRARKLLGHAGVRAAELVVYNEANERRQAPALVERIAKGATVVLVSDAGMPGLSDPGYRLVRACVDQGLEVVVIPGPNAAVSALAISGLPPGRFVFEGFLPRKTSERRRHLEQLRTERRTVVIYESPHRIEGCLEDLLEVLGERPMALARELTKMHEEVRRGSIAEVLEGVRRAPPKGEMVLVIGGSVHEHNEVLPSGELARMARTLMADGVERKEALSQVAKETGMPRRAVFEALLDRPD